MAKKPFSVCDYIKPEDVQEYKVRYIGGVLQFL